MKISPSYFNFAIKCQSEKKNQPTVCFRMLFTLRSLQIVSCQTSPTNIKSIRNLKQRINLPVSNKYSPYFPNLVLPGTNTDLSGLWYYLLIFNARL